VGAPSWPPDRRCLHHCGFRPTIFLGMSPYVKLFGRRPMKVSPQAQGPASEKLHEMAGNAAAPAAGLRTRRCGYCVTNRRSLPRGAVRRRGIAALRTDAFMEPSHTGCAAGGYHRAPCPASGLWPMKGRPQGQLWHSPESPGRRCPAGRPGTRFPTFRPERTRRFRGEWACPCRRR
jgi:hypothetical protein